MTKILDINFPSSEQINSLPCFASDRHLEKITESVTVTQCCQDPDNSSLVVIDFVLVGAFYFVPYVKILKVDDDSTYETRGITAPLAIGHFKNPDIPIDTRCLTYHGQVVFDFGSVIPDYTTCTTIEFELGMIGQVPQAYGVTFPTQTPTDRYSWQKGVLPIPVAISYANGNYSIVFEYKGNRNCSCAIQCVVPSGVSNNIQFCPDETQSITTYVGDLTDDPSTILISLRDSVGNLSVLELQPLLQVKPATPIIASQSSPSRIEVGITKTSTGGTYLENVQYQILKYEGTANNYIVWKDWSNRQNLTFIDTEVLPYKTYGYAVRYKGAFDEISNLSDWNSITL